MSELAARLHDALGPVLVANRGEIAWRVLRGCRDLGLATVAVYSEADRDAPWLQAADDAHLLGPAAASESYLSVDRLLEAAQRAGAGAIHPGYGFLSENADFADAVTGAGLVWIGPPAAAIRRLGDKLSARATATAAGCPIVPGTGEPTADPQVVREFAREHGYPVAVKAAFGGGGRGLKVVREESALTDALESAQREAEAAFGRGEVYVERYLARPRHVEIQILADQHGHTLFLGERDCSSQRRHQKLIEEAPAPGLDPEVRAAMGAASVRVAQEVGYAGAGTCEFLYEDDDFYFLEMNARLQVEHPVTELVTGIDLVAWQLRVAAGEALDFGQDDVQFRGHALEARINAEHVASGFVPSPGLITALRLPGGPGVRVDAGVEAGWEISGSYDSLMAKLITYGADREEARRRMLRALDEFQVEGVPTTLDFHRVAFRHDDFVAGRVSTVSVEREWDLSNIAAAPAATPGDGPPTPTRSFTVEVGGRRMEVALFAPGGLQPGEPPPPRRREAGHAEARAQAPSPVADDAASPSAPASTPAAGGGSGDGSGEMVAPMQGTIIKVAVGVGDEVAEGDVVVVLEAMKMENAMTAPRAGTVTSLPVAVGDVVNAGDPLAVIGD